MNSNETYMTLTLNKAWTHQLRTYPNPAVVCLVLSDGEIVAVEAHQKAGTSHAEILALLSAYDTPSNNKIDLMLIRLISFFLLYLKDFLLTVLCL